MGIWREEESWKESEILFSLPLVSVPLPAGLRLLLRHTPATPVQGGEGFIRVPFLFGTSILHQPPQLYISHSKAPVCTLLLFS